MMLDIGMYFHSRIFMSVTHVNSLPNTMPDTNFGMI